MIRSQKEIQKSENKRKKEKKGRTNFKVRGPYGLCVDWSPDLPSKTIDIGTNACMCLYDELKSLGCPRLISSSRSFHCQNIRKMSTIESRPVKFP